VLTAEPKDITSVNQPTPEFHPVELEAQQALYIEI
jgi:hypothetical protein